jgi:CBS domain-containing protein
MRTVRDIMNTDLIHVRTGTPVEELIQLLDDEGISGVPVLDSADQVRGVVSRTDVIRAAARAREVPAPDAFWDSLMATPEEGEEEESPWFLAPESAVFMVPADSFPAMAVGETLVDDIMTPVVFSVDPDMLIWELADFLVRGRIHRALVVEDERLVGIVTAFDVLRVMATDTGRS